MTVDVNVATIPVIDFGPFMVEQGVVIQAAPTEDQLAVARAIDQACRNHGFLYLTNFGLTAAQQAEMFAAARELFALPVEHKLTALRRIGSEDNRGYAPFRSESHHVARPPEESEKYNVRFPPAHPHDLTGCPARFVNLITKDDGDDPKDDADLLLPAILHRACHRYALALAVALNLSSNGNDADAEPYNFFSKTFSRMDQCSIRFLHAPPCEYNPAAVDDWKQPVRISEHTDFGLFTFVLHPSSSSSLSSTAATGAEGLQIRPVEGSDITQQDGATGQWQNVVIPQMENTTTTPKNHAAGALVNTGALLARWTNDEYKATAHRVVCQSAEMAQRDRYSLAFFADPDVGSVIDVPEALLLANNKVKKYEPTTSDAYLLAKLSEMGRGVVPEEEEEEEEATKVEEKKD
eukprot:scaffold12708_cov124-Amphora_coffeaeformis.AAC.1